MQSTTNRLFLTIVLLLASALSIEAQHNIIPQPQHVAEGDGRFQITKKTTIAYSEASLRKAAEYLQEAILKSTGIKTQLSQSAKGDITLVLKPTKDFYKLNVTKRKVEVEASTYNGLISGVATIRQLIDNKSIPAISVNDSPSYDWRGFHLDCSRHFFTLDEVKEVIDLMAMYKLNRFHWHLTDDQGWRIEIKKYPKLTEEGAWRLLNNQDSVCLKMASDEDDANMLLPEDRFQMKPLNASDNTMTKKYGGFYTQDEIRDIVRYAQTRGVEIVPEIDMPGHMLAAIDCYDGIACFETTGWGKVFTSPLCPGKDKTLQFCKDIWSEVCELFPYEYVHIGGDEVEKDNWKACSDCQQRMKEFNLQTEEELQSWFLHEMERYLISKGKRMIGWDEITEGGLSKTSTVMWWRTWAPTAIDEATQQGNDVIYTPMTPLYLSARSEPSSIEQIYNFNLQPQSLTEEQRSHILGAQANLWGEWIPSRNRMMYMYFPRVMALAELVWSSKYARDYDDFSRRLPYHYAMLQRMNVPYKIPALKGFLDVNAFTDTAILNVKCSDPYATIRYTEDGTFPNMQSKVYDKPLLVDKTTHFILRPFSPDGRGDEMTHVDFVKQGLLEPLAVTNSLESGLIANWYDYKGATCREITKSKFNQTFIVDDVSIPSEAKGNIGLVLTGFISVPQDGIYTFSLTSDDGSWLKIDGNMVVDNDREQSPHEMIGQCAMKAGLHHIEVRYFDYNGGMLRMEVKSPDGTMLNPATLYFH